jgi:pimeloyl-ACP methyl ester carboxylesterase
VNPRTMPQRSGQPAAAGLSGLVLVVHGGRSMGTEPTTPVQLSVLRMIPIARAIGHAVRGHKIEVWRPRFRVRGWNGDEASPVRDLSELLAEIADGPAPPPVLLVGHSMGARAALRVAGHPLVSGVAGLAPWLPSGEPVEQLAGRRVLLVHGDADSVTSPAGTWAYARRARAVVPTAAIEVRGGDHAMLRRPRVWHQLAAEFARESFGLPPGDAAARRAISPVAGPPAPVIL